MSTELETSKLAVPVLPHAISELPESVQQYLYEMDNYMQAMHRDIQKLGSNP